MTEQLEMSPATIRGEIRSLFGLRWDTAVEWAVISWLSAWFWSTYASGPPDAPAGPVTWTIASLQSLGAPAPDWLATFQSWLVDPSRGWLSWLMVAVAVVTCTAAVRSHRFSGLRTVALLSTALACEIHSSAAPALWVVLLATVPAALAFGIGFVDSRLSSRTEVPDRFYHPAGVVREFSTRILLLFLAPVIAPVLLLAMLVSSYRVEVPYSEVRELGHVVARELDALGSARAADTDALTAYAALAATQLAGNPSSEARSVASAALFHLTQRQTRERIAVPRMPSRVIDR